MATATAGTETGRPPKVSPQASGSQRHTSSPPDASAGVSPAAPLERVGIAGAIDPADSPRLAARLAANQRARESGERWCEYTPGKGVVWHGPLTPAERCARIARAEARRRQALTGAGIPEAFAGANFYADETGADLERHEGNAEAYRLALLLSERWERGKKGLVLASPSYGCGKTYLLTALLIALHRERGAKVRMVKAARLLQLYRDSFGATWADKPGVLGAPQIWAEYAEHPDVLLIDEMGGEKIASGEAGDWAREKVLLLIDFCTDQKKTVLATTNLSREELAAKYGGRTASRLLGRSVYVEMDGPDYRQRPKGPVQSADPFSE